MVYYLSFFFVTEIHFIHLQIIQWLFLYLDIARGVAQNSGPLVWAIRLAPMLTWSLTVRPLFQQVEDNSYTWSKNTSHIFGLMIKYHLNENTSCESDIVWVRIGKMHITTFAHVQVHFNPLRAGVDWTIVYCYKGVKGCFGKHLSLFLI